MGTVVISQTEMKAPTSAPWLVPWSKEGRPWTELYGLRIRPKARPVERLHVAFKDILKLSATYLDVEQAPIQKMLPVDLMLKIFSYLPAYELGRLPLVCSTWVDYAKEDMLWKSHCQLAFQADPPGMLEMQYKLYKYSWRDMFRKRPHVRFDGLYVSRNTYIHVGVTEWKIKNPVHLVAYFRYLRFFPNGSLLSRTSPEVVSKVERSLRKIPDAVKPDDTVHIGRWHLQDNVLRTKMKLPNTCGTEIWTKLKVRSKFGEGSNNRLDVLNIFSHDQGFSIDIIGGQAEEDLDAGALKHTRGMSTFTFIAEEDLHTHVLNSPDLDFYIPG